MLSAYGNFKIKPMGKVILECVSNNIISIECFVIEKIVQQFWD